MGCQCLCPQPQPHPQEDDADGHDDAAGHPFDEGTEAEKVDILRFRFFDSHFGHSGFDSEFLTSASNSLLQSLQIYS